METSENSPEANSNQLTLSQGDSPARISAKPGSESASRALARAFGLSSPVLLGSFDPGMCLLRTYQACLFQEQCQEWSENWPDSGMWDCGGVYELRSSAPATSESGCSLWPTTRSSSGGGNKSAYEGAEYRPALAQRAQTWPTATSGESKGRAYQYDNHDKSKPRLSLTGEAQTWTIARQEDGESCGNHPGAVDSLTGATRLWPTPNVPNGGRKGSTSNYDEQGNKRQVDLGAIAPLWRTPDTPGTGGTRNRQGSIGAGHQITIAEQAEHWQTPATDSFRSREGDRKDEQLQNFMEHHFDSPPAPVTPDGPPSSEKGPTSRRRLNPRFVEWLMGFEPTWTEL